MDTRFEEHRKQLVADLAARNLDVTPGAWRPLERIGWARLAAVHDHEEKFLREKLIDCIAMANRKRMMSKEGTNKVNAHDVMTAILMLAALLPMAADGLLSPKNREIIRKACPYC